MKLSKPEPPVVMKTDCICKLIDCHGDFEPDVFIDWSFSKFTDVISW